MRVAITHHHNFVGLNLLTNMDNKNKDPKWLSKDPVLKETMLKNPNDVENIKPGHVIREKGGFSRGRGRGRGLVHVRYYYLCV